MKVLFFFIVILILLILVLFSEKSAVIRMILKLIAFVLLIPMIIGISFILQGLIEEWGYTWQGKTMIAFYYFSFFTLLLGTFFTKKISHR